jgi:pancreatic triacylglycerol lipase
MDSLTQFLASILQASKDTHRRILLKLMRASHFVTTGPLFAERRPDGRINSGDARYVECLHTNGGLTGAGIGAHICDADFFPNGGSSQPGCLLPGCSHSRAVEFYVESIQNNGFHSVRCDTERQASRENCNSGGGQW